MSESAKKLATVSDLLALHEDQGMELVEGEIVRKTLPTVTHGRRQRKIGTLLDPFDQPESKDDGPGGWWIGTEVDVRYNDHNVYRHDIAGWRRDRVPQEPKSLPVEELPDWVCEILSTSNRSNDTVRKFRRLFQAKVPYYWIVDPRDNELTVFKWEKIGFAAIEKAFPGEVKRLPPFEEIEIDIAELFGVE